MIHALEIFWKDYFEQFFRLALLDAGSACAAITDGKAELKVSATGNSEISESRLAIGPLPGESQDEFGTDASLSVTGSKFVMVFVSSVTPASQLGKPKF